MLVGNDLGIDVIENHTIDMIDTDEDELLTILDGKAL